MVWLKTELRALLEFILLPGLAAVLPWPTCFRLFRRVARWRWLYRSQTDAALSVASRHVPVADPADWAWRHRLCLLIDHSDFWLSRFRTDRWRQRYLRQTGDWPPSGRGHMVLFFHSGPGLWPARALRAAGHRASFLSARLERRAMGGSWLGHRYGRARLDELARATGLPVTSPPGATAQCRAILAAGDSVLGMPDVPPGETRRAQPVRLFGRAAWFPAGLIEAARLADAPVLLIDFPPGVDDGLRHVRILGQFQPNDPGLLQTIVDHWQQSLIEAPWAFTLWPMFEDFFNPPQPPSTPQ
jgi:hypothetical protein